VVGERIREQRKTAGFSLRELAGKIGLTPGYLSRVENGQIKPSLDSLQTIATTLGVPMFTFLEDQNPDPIVKNSERAKLFFPKSNITYELLTPRPFKQMMSVMIDLEPGARREIHHVLPSTTEQWMYVLNGRLSIQIDNQEYTLEKDDTITYNGDLLQEFSSVGEETLKVICTIIPPVL
jgi:transcriptional regulator with XRE-family HTH domain